MLKFLSLSLTLFFLSMAYGGEVQDFQINQKVTMIGRLSSDLKQPPKLDTFSPKGIPIHVVLKAKGRLGISLVGFRGQKVESSIVITKIVNIRNCEAELEQIKPSKAEIADF